MVGSLTGWSRRKLFALPVPTANLTDFPNCIKIIADGKIGAACRADGFDIRFTAVDGITLLPYERESFAVAGGEATGIFWVKSDVAMAGTYIWLYYGNLSATDGENHEAVWNANYKLVAHMNDLTTSTIHDSTSNHNNGAKLAANEPIEAAGKIGKGQDFDGANDYISVGDGASLQFGTGSFTVEGWVNQAGYAGILEKRSGGTGWIFATGPPYTYLILHGDSYAFPGIPAGSFQHFVMVVDRVSNLATLYMNGTPGTPINISATAETSNSPGTNLWLGKSNDPTYVDGVLDEMRVSGATRSAAWIAYEYANMNPADGGLTWGEEVSLFMEILLNAYELIVIRAKAVTFRANGAATASGNSKLTPVKVTQFKEAEFFLDVTAASGTTPTLNVAIVTKDPISGKWFTLVSFTQATGVTTERKVVTGNLGAFLAATWAIGGTGSPTFAFSIGAVLKAE